MAGIDAYTIVCLHLDSDLTNSASSGLTFTAGGGAAISSAQKKFGAGSLYSDGTGDYIYSGDSTYWNFGSQNFAIDMWVRYSSVDTENRVFCGRYITGTNKRSFMWRRSSGNVQAYFSADGTNATALDFGAWTPTQDVWYWVALSRSGNTIRCYIDGSKFGDDKTFSSAIYDSDEAFEIGAYNSGVSGSFHGYIDEPRISLGTDRGWTGATISVPTEAYSEDATGQFMSCNRGYW